MPQDSLFGELGQPTREELARPSAGELFHPSSGAPLAVRMRPRTLDEVVGQDRVLGPGTPLRRLIDGAGEASVILYGPPGTGKTTIASLISAATGYHFEGLSALNAGVKEVRAVIDQAKRARMSGRRTVLFIDEVHRFSRTQQDALLAAVENRTVLLVAATTENPSFSVVTPLLSRSLLVQLESLCEADLTQLIRRALNDDRGLKGRITATNEAVHQLALLAGGDARRALTYLEAASEAVADDGELSVAEVKANVHRAVVRYDRDGDQHYDVTSAFIKSVRGSDVDAALHYLARMIDAGEDPRFIARRLVILASEDIGMADPTAIQVAMAAADAVQFIGLPEGRLPLAQAAIHLATAPKSHSVVAAIDAALADVRAGRGGAVPPHLRDGHYEGAQAMGNAVGYRYPHDDPRGVVAQQYLPDELQGARYYQPSEHGAERSVAGYIESLRGIVHGANGA